MTIYPQCAATEEDGPQFDPILSNHVFPKQLARLREAGRKMTVFNKLSRETARFHEELARKHGVNTPRGLAHFKAAKAFREPNGKLMEFFNQQPQQAGQPDQGLDPKAKMNMHSSAIKHHKKAAEKAGLDTDEGHAHVAMMEKHMDALRDAKNQHKQKKQAKASTHGASGRKVPFGGVPKKSEQRNQDIHQNKMPIELPPGSANKAPRRNTPEAGRVFGRQGFGKMRASGKRQVFVAPRYDKSHPEGFKKDYGQEA